MTFSPVLPDPVRTDSLIGDFSSSDVLRAVRVPGDPARAEAVRRNTTRNRPSPPEWPFVIV
ncbi:hypothetical protein GCM10019016_029330 [Streptomyces prasinosporus]|uniref:Uncharacterized protein n=1 Tax=Streptomyces prasinosporus TaxID=68256 RepID=A0ABP6TKS5_9ACTN